MVATIKLNIEVFVDSFVLIGLRGVFERDDHIPRTRWIGKFEVDVFMAFRQNDEFAFDLLDLPDALLSLSCLGGFISKFIDEDLHMSDIALLSGTLCTHLLKVVLALLEVRAVIASIRGNTTVLESSNVVDAGIHECAVMAYDEDRAFIAGDKAAKPLNAFEVKVVCRLVEQKKIGVAEKKLSECDAHLPASGKLGACPCKIFRVKTESRKNLFRIAFKLVAAKMFKTILNATIFV